MPMYLHIKDAFIRELAKHFDKKMEIDKRLSIVSDLQMFRAKEDPFVWSEKKGLAPEHFMVYFDSEHICTFNLNDSVKKVMLLFWKGFREAYAKKRIKLTPPRMRVEVKKETPTQQALKRLEKIKPTTGAERMAKEIVKKVIKGDK
jgi:hypothetical protein